MLLLAYLFWHSPQQGFPAERYESALAGFHGALADAPPPGFRGSAAFRVDRPDWAGDYEDWYLVDDWHALGVLNLAAVTDPRRGPHDTVGERTAWGAGGVYQLIQGNPDPAASPAAVWLQKPREESYRDFRERLSSLPDPAWQRQLVLGPGEEFCLLSEAPPEGIPRPVISTRTPVFPPPRPG